MAGCEGQPRTLVPDARDDPGIRVGQLEQSGEAETTRRAHAHYYLQLAEQSERHLWGAALYEESLMLAAELGDRRCQAAALNNLGRLAHRMGDEARAVALCSKRLSLQRGPGDKRSMATALASLGQITGS